MSPTRAIFFGLVPILLFIAGFTIVFTLLGAFSQRFVPIFKGEAGQRIGGSVVVLIGLFMIGYALRRGSVNTPIAVRGAAMRCSSENRRGSGRRVACKGVAGNAWTSDSRGGHPA